MVKVTRILKCSTCGKLFRAKRVTKKFCSDKCRSLDASYKRQGERHSDCPGTCRNKKHVPCSNGCGRGVWLGAGSAESPICRECRLAAAVQDGGVKVDGIWKYQRVCEECGKDFLGQTRRSRFCSLQCNGKSKASAEYASESERQTVKGHRRRARLRGLMAEEVVPSKVFERDNWTCQLCDEPVDKSLSGRDPMGPSLDHIVPISMGGLHCYSNVQLAHLSCNSKKGNRVDGQIALVFAT